jgi:hypothetical protein
MALKPQMDADGPLCRSAAGKRAGCPAAVETIIAGNWLVSYHFVFIIGLEVGTFSGDMGRAFPVFFATPELPLALFIDNPHIFSLTLPRSSTANNASSPSTGSSNRLPTVPGHHLASWGIPAKLLCRPGGQS